MEMSIFVKCPFVESVFLWEVSLCGKFPSMRSVPLREVSLCGSVPTWEGRCCWKYAFILMYVGSQSLCEKFPLLKKYVLDASKLIDKEIIFF